MDHHHQPALFPQPVALGLGYCGAKWHPWGQVIPGPLLWESWCSCWRKRPSCHAPDLRSFQRSRLTSKTVVVAPDQVSAKARAPLEAVAKERTTEDYLKDSNVKEEALISSSTEQLKPNPTCHWIYPGPAGSGREKLLSSVCTP